MPETSSDTRLNVMSLILVPAAITLAVTILRVVGELQHWSPRLFNSSAGGGGALVGIWWLPIIFGPYFALKLAGAGEGPARLGHAIGYAVAGVVAFMAAGFITFAPVVKFPGKIFVGILGMAAAAGLQFANWPAFAKTLLAYAYAARFPVAIVSFFAIRGNWGTHYDAMPPEYRGPMTFWGRYIVPQLVFWVVYTVIVGSLLGTIAAAIARRAKPAAQAAS